MRMKSCIIPSPLGEILLAAEDGALCGLWFRGHPLFSGQGLRLGSKPAVPVSTYVPYIAAGGTALAPSGTILKAEEPAVPLSRFYTTERATVFTFSGIEREKELNAVLEANRDIKTAAIITGPEGGFASFEADLARICGLHICSMGERILRCETAPVVALTAAMYATGNLS